MRTAPRVECFLSIAIDQLGHDPEPYFDPVTGSRMEHARYNPVNIHDPRPEFIRATHLPLSAAMATFRRVWDEQVHGGVEFPEIVAHQFAGASSRSVWGDDASSAQIAHARLVAGKLARVLSDGALVSL